MFPPLAVTASVEICAPLFINRRAAETVIDPASPLPVDCAVICGPGPGSTMSEATITLTSPPVPGPAVVLAICAPPPTVRELALTATDPALPLTLEVAEATIPVPDPVRVSGPCALTSTAPPLPDPIASLEMAPRLTMTKDPAATVIVPAFPLPRVRATMPVKFVLADVPSIDSEPAMLTDTLPPCPDAFSAVVLAIAPLLEIVKAPALMLRLPALPGPAVPAEILPSFRRAKLPALTAILPAFPVLPRLACEEIPVNMPGVIAPSMVSPPVALTETSPPLPCPKVLLAISPLFIMERVLALTLTVPAFPVLPWETIPVAKRWSPVAPSIISAPAI